MTDLFASLGLPFAEPPKKDRAPDGPVRRSPSSKPSLDDAPSLDLPVQGDRGVAVAGIERQLDIFGDLLPPHVMGEIRIAARVLTIDEVSALWHRCFKKNYDREDLLTPRREMAELMAAGRFPQNGETLVIARNGDLIDGIQRVGAAFEAGVPLPAWVVTGVPSERMHQIDLRTKREPWHRAPPDPAWAGATDPLHAMRREASRDFGQRPVFLWLTRDRAGRLLNTVYSRTYLGAKRESHYEQILADVRDSMFTLTGQAVLKIDRKGNLLDGHKVCRAVHRTGISVPCLAMYDVDSSLAGTFDLGRRHSTAHRLFSRGYAWGYDDPPATKTMERILRDNRSWDVPDSRVHSYHAAYSGELSLSVRASRPCKQFLLQRATVPLHYRFSQIAPLRAEAFFEALTSALEAYDNGVQSPLDPSHPVSALIDHLSTSGVLGTPPRRRDDETPEVWAIIQAWNAFVTGRPPEFEAPHGNGYPPIARGAAN